MTSRFVRCSARFLLFFLVASVAFSRWSTGNANLQMERTLAMIKPDGLRGNYSEKIKKTILDSGFSIVNVTIFKFDEESAGRFYAEHSSRNFFSSLIKYITSGPVLALVLEKENAVADWRALIGPTDAQKAKITHPYRAMCGLDSEKNCVHGSDSVQSGEREISIIFNQEKGEVVAKHDEL